ncbi:MAG: hypothetical protein GY926_19655 [bacterium]|nr:hypothetical protein [bacterium]
MISIDLSNTVRRFAKDYTVRTRAAASFVNGELVPGAETSRTTKLLIYPMTGRELMRLPENERQQSKVTIFSAETFHSGDRSDQVPAEIIEYGGDDYEIDKREAWTDQGKYWQGSATLKGRG